MNFFWPKQTKYMYSFNGQRATLQEFKYSHHYMEMQHLEKKHQWWIDNISINVIDIIESIRPPLIPRVSLECAHIDWNLGWGRDSTACTYVLEQLRWRLQHTPASPSAGCVFVVRLKVSPPDSLSPEINKLPLWFMNSHLVVTQHQIIQANRNWGYFFPLISVSRWSTDAMLCLFWIELCLYIHYFLFLLLAAPFLWSHSQSCSSFTTSIKFPLWSSNRTPIDQRSSIFPPIYSVSVLCTCPNHLNLASLALQHFQNVQSPSDVLILSIPVTPKVKPNIKFLPLWFCPSLYFIQSSHNPHASRLHNVLLPH